MTYTVFGLQKWSRKSIRARYMVFRPHLWILPPTFKKYWPPLHFNILSHLKLFDKLHTFSVRHLHLFNLKWTDYFFFGPPFPNLPILNSIPPSFFLSQKALLEIYVHATISRNGNYSRKLPWRWQLSWVLHSPLSTNIRCSPGKKNFFYAFVFFTQIVFPHKQMWSPYC